MKNENSINKKHIIVLLLGSNLGDRLENLSKTERKLDFSLKAPAIQRSKIYETAAWGKENQQAFLNQVLIYSSDLKPLELLDKTQEIEFELGRERKEKWGPRCIDIDILYYGSAIVNTSRLKVPHPYIQERKFTLLPLVELQAQFIHPVFGLSNSELLKNCGDKLAVKEYQGE